MMSDNKFCIAEFSIDLASKKLPGLYVFYSGWVYTFVETRPGCIVLGDYKDPWATKIIPTEWISTLKREGKIGVLIPYGLRDLFDGIKIVLSEVSLPIEYGDI